MFFVYPFQFEQFKEARRSSEQIMFQSHPMSSTASSTTVTLFLLVLITGKLPVNLRFGSLDTAAGKTHDKKIHSVFSILLIDFGATAVGNYSKTRICISKRFHSISLYAANIFAQLLKILTNHIAFDSVISVS